SEQRAHDLGEDGGVTGVVHMEFVETDEPGLAEQIPDRPFPGPRFMAVGGVAGMELAEEFVKMDAACVLSGHGFIEGVGQPALSAPHRSPDIDTTRRRPEKAPTPG